MDGSTCMAAFPCYTAPETRNNSINNHRLIDRRESQCIKQATRVRRDILADMACATSPSLFITPNDSITWIVGPPYGPTLIYSFSSSSIDLLLISTHFLIYQLNCDVYHKSQPRGLGLTSLLINWGRSHSFAVATHSFIQLRETSKRKKT